MSRSNAEWRSANYLRQFKAALAFRLIAILVSILTVPVLIRHLGLEGFGVWSTLLAFSSWLTLLDLGIANGLRNKVAESLATNSYTSAKRYIGSSYLLLALIALAVGATLNIGAYFITWQSVFNTVVIDELTLRSTVQVAVFFTLLNLSLGLVGTLFSAVQKTSLVSLGQLASNLLLLTSVLILLKPSAEYIGILALIFGVSTIFANVALSVVFYKTHPHLRPIMCLDIPHIRPLLVSSLQFFIIQLAVLVILTTDKLLIAQFFGPGQVAEYEVVLKLFSLVLLGHSLLSLPLWSSYTDAYARADFLWIRRMLQIQLIIFFVILVSIALLIILAPKIIQIWLGDSFVTSTRLIVVTGAFTLISIWNNIFATFVNGIGRIRVQLYAAAFAMSANIPVSIFLVKNTNWGVSAIIVGTCVSLLIVALALPIHVRYIVRDLNTEPQCPK